LRQELSRSDFGHPSAETNDLIYEGIATSDIFSLRVTPVETNDLIYEGIATFYRETL